MSDTKNHFPGRTIIITGAASGVGRATALIFAREGCNVACIDIDEPGAQDTAREAMSLGVQALALRADVSKRPEVDAAVETVSKTLGFVSFLFNCAGAAFKRVGFLGIDDELLAKTFALNVNGTFHTMQAVLPAMLEQGYGVIVNVASLAHKKGAPGSSIHYASAKAAVLTMTLGVAREFADRGIRCLSISPGSIRTPFQERAGTSAEMVEKFMSDIPMKRYAEPEEIGELVLFMCSRKCEFMTADTVYVSGGGR